MNLGGSFAPGEDKSAKALQIEQWLEDGAELYRHGQVPSPDYLARANLAVDIGNNSPTSLGSDNYVDYYANVNRPSEGTDGRMRHVEITGIDNGKLTVVFSGVGDEAKLVRLTQPLESGAEGPWNADICRRIPASTTGTQTPAAQADGAGLEVLRTLSSDGSGTVTVVENPNATPSPDPSDHHFTNYAAPATDLHPLTQDLGLASTLIGLKNWSQQTDLGKLGTAVGLYNTLNTYGLSGEAIASGATNNLGLGSLSTLGSGLGLISALDSGNPISIASSGGSFYNSMAGSMGMTQISIPVLNALNIAGAIQSGNPLSIASSVAACFPPYGTVISLCLSVFGGLLGNNAPPPPPDGLVSYQLGEDGSITIQTEHNVSGGADSATSTAGSLLGILQSVIDANNDAIVPQWQVQTLLAHQQAHSWDQEPPLIHYEFHSCSRIFHGGCSPKTHSKCARTLRQRPTKPSAGRGERSAKVGRLGALCANRCSNKTAQSVNYFTRKL